MKFITAYNDLLHCKNDSDTFNMLLSTLVDSIRVWDYYVNWSKVIKSTSVIESSLHLLDYLLGKDINEKELSFLLGKYPDVVSVFPILIACREKTLTLLEIDSEGNYTYDKFSFTPQKSYSDIDIKNYLTFWEESGLAFIFKEKLISSVKDFVFGVEVGMDTNARKNRSGNEMESLVEKHINPICKDLGIEYLSQATQKKIQSAWDITIPIGEKNLTCDFAVKTEDKIFLIEVNYYGGGGSKLSAISGSYTNVSSGFQSYDIEYVWITDGLGWRSASKDLKDASNKIDYILNLNFVKKGILKEIFKLK